MKSLVVVDKSNETKYGHFLDLLSEILKAYGEVDVLSLASEEMAHTRFSKIRDAGMDILFTVDLVGFDILTTGGILGYNKLVCKTAHLILDDGCLKEEYTNKRMNLSMFLYANSVNILSRFSPEVIGFVQMEKLPEEFMDNAVVTKAWVQKFLKDAELID